MNENSKRDSKKITMTYLVALFFFSIISFPQSPYFPITGGSEWKYREEKGGRIQTITLGMDKIWHNFYFHGESIKIDEAFPGKFYPLTQSLNSTWLIPEKPDIPCLSGNLATCTNRSRLIETPAGKFYNCVVISYKGNCADAGIIEETFAPGIGLVQRKAESIMGEITWNLISCLVGGQEYPKKIPPAKENGIIFQAEVSSMSAKRGYETATITVRAKVINYTDEPINLTFKQEPYLTARLLDDEDHEVASSPVSVTSIFSNPKIIKINPGQNKGFSTKITISPSKLPEGNCSIVIELPSQPKLSAILPFRIIP